MTAAAIAMGLRSRYPLQAARAKAFHRYLRAMGPWDATPERDAVRAHKLTMWTMVCVLLDKEPINVC